MSRSMEATDPDSILDARPGKRVRPNVPQSPPQESDFDDTEDFYESPAIPQLSQASKYTQPKSFQAAVLAEASTGSLPGLGLLGSPTAATALQAPDDHISKLQHISPNGVTEAESSSAAYHHNYHAGGRPLKPPEPPATSLDNEARDNSVVDNHGDGSNEGIAEAPGDSNGMKDPTLDKATENDPAAAYSNGASKVTSLNQYDEDPEWQDDSSDGKSDQSSSSSSDSGVSGNSEDEPYELLGAEEQARILMEAGSEDEDKDSKSRTRNQPRTTNERAEVITTKPDVVVTSDMNSPELGLAEGVIENYLLIRGTVSGESRVLESGSILCLEDRTVIGVVAETLGRVEAPLYSVAFASPQEVESYGISKGTKIYYVEKHSTYVFTQPLKLLKGSDASNLHDEEIGDDLAEFSDDEAEAEHKKRIKLMRQSKRVKLPESASATGTHSKTVLSRSAYGTGYPAKPISYDEEDGDGLYTPLARPSSVFDQALPPKPLTLSQQFRGQFARGRDGRGRGQRANKGNERSGRNHRGSSRDPALVQTGTQNQSRSDVDAFSPSAHAPNSYHSFQSVSGHPELHLTQPISSPVGASQNGHWPQSQQSPYWTPDYSNFSPSYRTAYQPPATPLPPGSFVNPAFFRSQQRASPPVANSYQNLQMYGQSTAQRSYQQATFPIDQSSAELTSAKEEYDPTRPWID